MLTIDAPAKINLTLEVLGKRDDGYHEIRSVIQAISLKDILHFTKHDTIEIVGDSAVWEAGKSLVSRAANMLKNLTAYPFGARIEVEKRIPLMAGLGGDSSDAATVLVGLNELWELNIEREKLLELASQLGSDVTFFLYGGTCLMEGRGEIITPLQSIKDQWGILAIPYLASLPGKTRKMFESLKPPHFTNGRITEKVVNEIIKGHTVDSSCLFNTFENIALNSGVELATYRDHILKIGAPHVHLAGSGPAMYTLTQNQNEADDLAKKMKNQGMDVFVIKTEPGIGGQYAGS